MVFMLIRNMNKSAITLLVLVKHNQLYLFPVLSFLFQHPTPRGCYMCIKPYQAFKWIVNSLGEVPKTSMGGRVDKVI